jgi:hypothetical protein
MGVPTANVTIAPIGQRIQESDCMPSAGEWQGGAKSPKEAPSPSFVFC